VERLATIFGIYTLVLVSLIACDSPIGPHGGGPLATSTIPPETLRTPIPLPPTRVVTPDTGPLYTVTPRPSEAADNLGVLWHPTSGKIVQGQAYIFSLYTHCGLDQYVDFDGSFWEAAEPAYRVWGNAPPGVGNPGQLGTITLLDVDHARFEFDGGSFDFIRHIGPKVTSGCY
jgi:hypothetical protein